jgi:tetratricopeptide (TPR) repeat protein
MENLGKEEEEFWSSGMTADLITKVKGAGLIRVAPLDDILKLDKDLSIEEKAKKLRVKYILTHSFKIKEDGFELWSTLENIENGVALFSNKISEPMDMTTQMVGKLANDIITSLKIQTKQDVMKAPTANTEAYEYYLKAKYLVNEFELKTLNRANLEIARGLLQQVIELDNNFFEAIILLGDTHYNEAFFSRDRNNKLIKAMHIYKQVLQQTKELDDKLWEGRSLRHIGKTYHVRDSLDLALEYYNRSLIISEILGDKFGLGHSIRNIGLIYYNKLELRKALNSFEHSLKIFKEINDLNGISGSLGNIARIYKKQGNYNKALEYFKRTSDIFETHENQHAFAMRLFELGRIYAYQGEYEEALNSYNRSLTIHENNNYKYIIVALLSSIGEIYIEKNNYNKALEYLEKSVILHKELNLGESSLPPIMTLANTTFLYLSYKNVNKKYDINELHALIKEAEEIGFRLNYFIYQLLEDKTYLETAYNQVKEKADNLEPDIAAKFLSYPIPKAIVEEWEKVK